jgi:molybdate/tungstate transport system substrate-binding protein
MVLAFRRHSRAANRITNQNWHHVLLEEETVVGRANPEHDPCGYRTEMVFQLAERHYARPGLAASLAAKAGPRTMRPKETDLLALLEAKELDYIFIYRSVAAQHGLMQVSLPARIHLGSPEHAAYYRQASVQVTGKRPGERITLHGIPIAYSVTIPKAAPNPAVAEAFVALLLSPEGQSILERCGQRPLRPAVTKEFDRLPASLRPLCSRWV